MKRLILYIFFSFLSIATFAQGKNASITGLATDSSGARLSGVTVTANNTQTNISHAIQTDSRGEYTLVDLPPGVYNITASSPGFQKEERLTIPLDVQQNSRIDFSLKLGESEVVNVRDIPALLQNQSSEVGTVIDNQKVVDLPLNGRQFYSLALLSPAALPPAQNSSNGFRGGFNVAGQTETANNFYVNGIIDVDQIANYPAFRPSVETLQEFKLLTGTYAAEYGLRFGGQVEIVTKSGGNEFHGDLFEFIRNQATDAKAYFNTTGKATALKQNQFGGTIGGPIWKDHTFFFFGYEGIRLRQGVAIRTTVPTGDIDTYNMRKGDFRQLLTLATPVHVYTPGTNTDFATPNVISQSYLNTLGQTIANVYPQPTFVTPSGSAPANNYLDTDVGREAGNEGSLRIDHNLGNKDQLFLNYNLFNDPNYGANSSQCGASILPGFGCDQTTVSQLVAIGETHTFGSHTVNEFRIGGNRYHQKRSVDTAEYAFRNLLNSNNLVPQAGGAGLTVATTNYPGTSFGQVPNNRYDTAKQVSDSVTWLHGSHTVKAGYTFINNLAVYVHDYQGSATLTFTPATATATTTFNSTGYDYADILIGHPSATSYSPLSIAVNTHPTTTNHLFYVQDDWRVNPYLTLNYGIRYELGTPLHATDGMTSTFDPTITGGGFRIANGQNGTAKYPYNEDKNNFAPRLGLAWRPFHDEKTVLRAASGIYFYSTPTETTGFGGFNHQVPYSFSAYSFNANKTTTQLALTSASALFPIAGGSAQPTTGLGFDPRFATPYIQQYSLGVQQALTNHLSLDVSYLGSTGTKLYNITNNNQPVPSPLNTTSTLQNAARPFPSWGNITWAQSEGKASYNALLVKLQQNYGNGLSFIVSYTYAHSIDDTAGVATNAGDSSKAFPQNSYNIAAEKGSSDYDVKSRLVISPVYVLPFGKNKHYLNHGLASVVAGGWQLSGILTAQTGTPFTVYNGGSNNNRSYTAQLSDRPNSVSNPNIGGARNAKQWFNTAAFTLQSIGTFGNEGRNTIRGPHYTDVDAAVVRRFPLKEKVDLQLRVEGFNLANHPNLYNPNTSTNGSLFGANGFGSISNTYAPRQLQAALKLVF